MNNNQNLLKKLQKYELDILIAFDEVCKKHDLRYFLAFGTLIGAARHNGFIPWDDDIDCYMPRADYNRLLLLDKTEKCFSFPFIMNHYSLPYYKNFSPQLKIENQNVKVSRIIGKTKMSVNCWIDIFPVDGMPSDNKKRIKHFKKVRRACNILSLSRVSKMGIKENKRSIYKNIIIFINKIVKVGNLFDIEKSQKKIDLLSSVFDYDKCEFVNGFIRAYGEKCIFPKKWLEPAIEVEFEGYRFKAPHKYDLVLNQIYGNYLQMPPESERICGHIYEIETIRAVK